MVSALGSAVSNVQSDSGQNVKCGVKIANQWLRDLLVCCGKDHMNLLTGTNDIVTTIDYSHVNLQSVSSYNLLLPNNYKQDINSLIFYVNINSLIKKITFIFDRLIKTIDY